MKLKNLFLLLSLSFPFFFSSCVEDKCEREITYFKTNQVYTPVSEFRKDAVLEPARELKKPGKIYYYNDMLFINEQKKGVHIYDNSNPSNPVNIGFISLLGNVDIAIKNDILYADSYVDLVTIDISDINNPETLSRTENVFEGYYWIDQSGQLLDYEYEEVTEMVDCNQDLEGGWLFDANGGINTALGSGEAVRGGSGTGGSLARFTIKDDHLYTIDHSTLYVFDINQGSNPTEVNEVHVNWQIETIFSYTDKLFIGSTTGMFIMDASNPSEPFHLSSYSHAYGCDPVFVKEPYAYVTLRSGNNWCADNGDQLDLVNISDMSNIYLEKTFEMENPHGLSIRDNNLFLCEGDDGLKVFDIQQPLQLDENRLAHLKDIKATDIIALHGEQNLLLVIGEEGFYQYDGTNAQDPDLLSIIRVK